jgi:hypothetical protein
MRPLAPIEVAIVPAAARGQLSFAGLRPMEARTQAKPAAPVLGEPSWRPTSAVPQTRP